MQDRLNEMLDARDAVARGVISHDGVTKYECEV